MEEREGGREGEREGGLGGRERREREVGKRKNVEYFSESK